MKKLSRTLAVLFLAAIAPMASAAETPAKIRANLESFRYPVGYQGGNIHILTFTGEDAQAAVKAWNAEFPSNQYMVIENPGAKQFLVEKHQINLHYGKDGDDLIWDGSSRPQGTPKFGLAIVRRVPFLTSHDGLGAMALICPVEGICWQLGDAKLTVEDWNKANPREQLELIPEAEYSALIKRFKSEFAGPNTKLIYEQRPDLMGIASTVEFVRAKK